MIDERRTGVVVHVTSVHPPGDPRIFQKECISLRDAGFCVTLVAAGACDATESGVNIKGVRRPRSRLDRALVAAPLATIAASRISADVYHLHDPELLPWAWILALTGKAVIYDMHEDLPHQLEDKPWIPKPLRGVAAAIVRGFERAVLRRMPTILAETSYETSRPWLAKATTVLNYPRLDRLSGLRDGAKRSGPFRFGYIGAVTAGRGSRTMLEAVAILQAEGLEVAFECVGRVAEAERTELTRIIERRGITGVTFHGYLDPADGWAVIAQCDAGMAVLAPLPNYVESYPTKLFEYMALGLPVVASDFPLYADIVDRYGCGLCVDPEDVQKVAAAMAELARDPGGAEAMGGRGRDAALVYHSWDSEQSRLLAFYDEVLGSGTRCVG